MSTRLARRVIGKAASYTINPSLDRAGTTFTNMGATGAITFTLPTPSYRLRGWYYRFKTVVDQDVLVASPAVDTLIATNDLAADSVGLATSSQKIGGIIEAECVEATAGVYKWAASVTAIGHAQTIAT